MPPSIRDLLLLSLVSANGRIAGRTTFQKLTYFYGMKTRIQTYHRAHYYGPYSRQVTVSLSSLISMGLVSEEKHLTGNDRTMYMYSITPVGRSIARQLAQRFKEYSKIKEITDVCSDKAQLDPDILAMASKVHYIASQTKRAKLTYKEVADMAKRFGWKLGQTDINAGVNLLKGLGFVK